MLPLKRLVIRTVVGLTLSLSFSYGVLRVLGPAFAMMSLAASLFVLRPLTLHALAVGWRGSKAKALAPVQGRFYSYKGVHVGVVEDIGHCRWVATNSVRKVIDGLTSDQVLARLYPSGWQRFGTEAYLREDAILAHLATATDMTAIRFRVWVQHSIATPAETIRQRLGVHDAFDRDIDS
jgi:hypothetical protein